MAETLREALRERLGFWAALQWAGVLAFLWYLFDPAPAQFATTVVSMAVFGLTELVTDVYDVRQSVRNGGFGIYALVGGAAMLLFDDGTLWVPIAFALVGVWFVADAVQTVRHEGATETEPTGREVYHDYVARQVHEAVEDRAHTRRELYEALEADDEAVDAAVERLESRGVVVREGSSIRAADTADDGLLARVSGRLGGLAGRVARPLTLELASGGDGESSERATADRTSESSADDRSKSGGGSKTEGGSKSRDEASDRDGRASAGDGEGRGERERETTD